MAREADQTEMSFLSERISDNKRFHHYWDCRFKWKTGRPSRRYRRMAGKPSDLVDELRDNRSRCQTGSKRRIANRRSSCRACRNSNDEAFKQLGRLPVRALARPARRVRVAPGATQGQRALGSRFLEELEARLEPEAARGSECWDRAFKGGLGL